MSVLVDWQIRDLIERVDMVANCNLDDQLNPASLDVRLGPIIQVETEEGWQQVDLARLSEPYRLLPGEFILAHTIEVFNLPDGSSDEAPAVAAQFVLKSSSARAALGHLLAGWCDPGWHSSTLTMELVNHSQFHPIELWVGRKVGQMKFLEVMKPNVSYRTSGRYNGDAVATPSKGF